MKEELIRGEGKIEDILPDGRFGVMLDNDHRLIAATAGRMRRFRMRSIIGGRVQFGCAGRRVPPARLRRCGASPHLAMSACDLAIGGIVPRERTAGGGPRRARFPTRRPR